MKGVRKRMFGKKQVEAPKTLVQRSIEAVTMIHDAANNLLALNQEIEEEQAMIRDEMEFEKSEHQRKMDALDSEHGELDDAKKKNARIAQKFMDLVA